jgi:peptide/nickel transport system ATP-binding protein
MSTLALRDLCVSYGNTPVVHGVTLEVARGQCVGLVGESGCGKSTIALAAMRALPRGGAVTRGRVEIAGRDIFALDREALRQLWAREIAMVYQDPSRALNPTMTIAAQLREAIGMTGTPSQDAARAALADMRIADPDRTLRAYPHQLSGGMQQRVVIAMALAKNPALLVLDEPTTGLDATVQADIMSLIDERRRSAGTAVLLISHNLALVGRIAERIGVLYAGLLVEEGPAARVLGQSRHPYTDALRQCLPSAGLTRSRAALQTIPGALPAPGALPQGCVFAQRCQVAQPLCHAQAPAWRGVSRHAALCHFDPPFAAPASAAAAPAPGTDTQAPSAAAPAQSAKDAPIVLQANDLAKTYAGAVRAVRDFSLALRAGETLGLVGESGSGKTTLARMLLGLIAPDAGGTILLDGDALPPTLQARTRAQRRALQIIFQNPDAALNRAQTVQTILKRPLIRLAQLRRRELPERIAALADAVRLNARQRSQYPRALSGGQKQRVAIARALAGQPRIVICDEPTSALDVSVQASILNLLTDLQGRTRVSYIFISHDLDVIRYMSDRIAVLYRGEIVQLGTAEAVFAGPHHPYTAMLLAAGREDHAEGGVAAEGCVFLDRCPRALGAICRTRPALNERGIRCHIAEDRL